MPISMTMTMMLCLCLRAIYVYVDCHVKLSSGHARKSRSLQLAMLTGSQSTFSTFRTLFLHRRKAVIHSRFSVVTAVTTVRLRSLGQNDRPFTAFDL